MKHQGMIVALITPFQKNGDLDLESFKRLVRFHINEGTKAVVVAGTTGEAPTLSSDELDSLLEVAVNESSGKMKIFAGTGTYSTRESVKATLRAKEIGADGCQAIFPYYNRPVFEGCFAHFKAISDCDFPLIVYYNPRRTGGQFSAEEISEICRLPSVFLLKDCSADPDFGLQIKKLSNKTFFAGDDLLLLSYLEKGAQGLISVLGNLIPRQINEVIDAFLSGDVEKARSLYQKIEPLCLTMGLETNPQCIKYAMSVMGHCEPVLRLPMVLPRLSVQKRIEEAINSL